MEAPRIVESLDDHWVTEILTTGGVVVAPTDTVFGMLADAFDVDAVNQVFEVKGRDSGKPPIVLIAELDELELFGITPTSKEKKFLDTYWPGPISVILKEGKTLDHLSRGSGGISFRVPNDPVLNGLLRVVGPLIAPSANPQGKRPAQNMKEAQGFFGELVTLYVEGEVENDIPSTLVSFLEGSPKVLREGLVKI